MHVSRLTRRVSSPKWTNDVVQRLVFVRTGCFIHGQPSTAKRLDIGEPRPFLGPSSNGWNTSAAPASRVMVRSVSKAGIVYSLSLVKVVIKQELIFFHNVRSRASR